MFQCNLVSLFKFAAKIIKKQIGNNLLSIETIHIHFKRLHEYRKLKGMAFKTSVYD